MSDLEQQFKLVRGVRARKPRVLLVGSANYGPQKLIDEVVRLIPKGSTFLIPNAPGAERYARLRAKKRKRKVTPVTLSSSKIVLRKRKVGGVSMEMPVAQPLSRTKISRELNALWKKSPPDVVIVFRVVGERDPRTEEIVKFFRGKMRSYKVKGEKGKAQEPVHILFPQKAVEYPSREARIARHRQEREEELRLEKIRETARGKEGKKPAKWEIAVYKLGAAIQREREHDAQRREELKKRLAAEKELFERWNQKGLRVDPDGQWWRRVGGMVPLVDEFNEIVVDDRGLIVWEPVMRPVPDPDDPR